MHVVKTCNIAVAVAVKCVSVWPVGRLAVLKASEQLKALEKPHKFYDHEWLSRDGKPRCPLVRFVAIDHRGCCGAITVWCM